jgi:SpoVK/Ycf46/Vps4 family AAA+-type ATPase
MNQDEIKQDSKPDSYQQKYEKYAEKTESDSGIKPLVPRYRLDKDVILPSDTMLRLKEALNKIKYHKVIYEEWDFKSVDPDGMGLSLSLYGMPGTGKTLIAEAIAGSLELPLISISLADLESKFMGETSKNIQVIFKKAQEYDAILFCDEADTLLGKRLSSVTQGIDNEVNACRSTLLIELEKFNGITIFATNFVENYDKAFQSRISYHVQIPLPDLEGREKMWRRFLIPTLPYVGDYNEIIDYAALGSEGFSGRDIRTAMRLALPKIFSHTTDTEHKGLSWELMEVAIAEVKKAQNEVGQYVNPRTKTSIENARSLMGIKEGE